MSRRRFLAVLGATTGATGLAGVLSACGPDQVGRGGFRAEPDGIVNFANWPLYIDKVKTADGKVRRPSLDRFTDETGILVNYREVIQEAGWFYDRIEPYLAAREPTGWDIIVITNGQALTKLMALGYLEELPGDLRPNFDLNAGDLARDPAYDPGNRFTMAWQSGITGIAYNPKLTGRRVTSLRDLFDPRFRGKVGMFADLVDCPNIALLAVGASPEESQPAEWREAADLLKRQKQAGIVREYYQQNYVKALQRGDVALTLAWSGDVYQMNPSGDPEGFRFVVPDDGALIWTDAMCVPKGAQHPADAIRLMDFVYRPEIAAMITRGVAYVSPVPEAQAVLLEMAQETIDAEESLQLEDLAASPLVFPAAEDVARLRTYRVLSEEEELEWNGLFGPIVGV